MMYWNGDWNWSAWLAMAVMMAAFWGVLGWTIVALGRGSRAPDRPSAEQILEERLARGEIAVDEYESLRTAIQTGRNLDRQSRR